MEERSNNEKKLVMCKKCGQLVEYYNEDTYWDYSGYMYNTKLVKCKCCETPIVLEYEEDKWMSEW